MDTAHKSIRDIVEAAVEAIAAPDRGDNVLRDSGAQVMLPAEDRAALVAAMEAVATEAAEGVEEGVGDFDRWGKWHRAANIIIAQHKIYGGDLAHRVLIHAVKSAYAGCATE